MGNLRNILVGLGVAAVGGIGTKMAVDYLRNRGEEKKVEESPQIAAAAASPTPKPAPEEVAYAVVEPSSVQEFLDKSFGKAGRYVPIRPPKVFEYQDENYMVVWAKDNDKNKNQMLAFIYRENVGRDMIASVGYTSEATDYNIDLATTPFAVEINGQQFKTGQGNTGGTDDVDLVLAG